MIHASNITLNFGKRFLFKDVNIKFTPGNCYGLIGANGAGKSTFLKIMSGEVEQTHGEIITTPGERLAVLKQDHYAFDEHKVIDTVIMGHEKLYEVMQARNEIYSKEEFTDEDGIRVSELEEEFEALNGYESESEAASLLKGLGITDDLHEKYMKDISGGEKVRILLAQALFGNPDILLLDEPTNHLDLASIKWLENFLMNFSNTVIVVSHDRHFLNNVCTHIADIDYGKIQVSVGNYDFWFHMTELRRKQMKDENKKKEDKAKELKEFIQRFSSNASKAKQATSRKKMLEKLDIENLPVSTRRFPYIDFKPERECGKAVLTIENLCKEIDGVKVLDNLSLIVNSNDKISFVGQNHLATTVLFKILMGEMEADSGEFTWGQTITKSLFPKDNSQYFENELNLLKWLAQYSEEKDESYLRGFLGRMLFSGDEIFKNVSVLSGGEKVRCMLSKMMLSNSNVLLLDEPTNHLDLESITALNDGLIRYTGVLLFSSQDHQFISSIANRIVEITPNGVIDRMMNFDDFINNEDVNKLRNEYYHGEVKPHV